MGNRLVFKLKSQIGANLIMKTEHELMKKDLQYLSRDKHPNLYILGNPEAVRFPTLSFVRMMNNVCLHQNFVCALLNDLFGLQTRSGCACAGPYGMDLMGIKDEQALSLMNSYVKSSTSLLKTGFTRLNLPFFLPEKKVDFILDCVGFVAQFGLIFLPVYEISKTGTFTCRFERKNGKMIQKSNDGSVDVEGILDVNQVNLLDDIPKLKVLSDTSKKSDTIEEKRKYLEEAVRISKEIINMTADENYYVERKSKSTMKSGKRAK